MIDPKKHSTGNFNSYKFYNLELFYVFFSILEFKRIEKDGTRSQLQTSSSNISVYFYPAEIKIH